MWYMLGLCSNMRQAVGLAGFPTAPKVLCDQHKGGVGCIVGSHAVVCFCCLLHRAVCREVVGLLRELKKEATLLVVSHDLADIAPLVDCAWRMKVGNNIGFSLSRASPCTCWPPRVHSCCCSSSSSVSTGRLHIVTCVEVD